MKKRLKRWIAGLLALVTVFTATLGNKDTVLAASATANILFWEASVKDSGEVSELKAGYNHGKILYAVLDGHVAYCMNFGLSADAGQLMNSYPNPDTPMTDKQDKLLSYCLYYGFSKKGTDAPTNANKNKFIATQAMIWNIVEGIYDKDSADKAAKKLCDTVPDTDESYKYYTTLKGKIDAAYNAVRPSFASKSKSGAETYELKWNLANQRFETTLKDTNKVLGDFDISLGGYTVDVSGNNVTISSKKANTSSTLATMDSNAGVVETTSSCVFWLTGKSGYQEFVSEKPTADPIHAYFKVKTEDIGFGKLTKQDEVTGVKLSGAVYGIYSDSNCLNIVDTITTGTDGTAISNPLIAGTYYVKEITAPKGYAVSDKVHTLVIKAGETTSFIANDKEQLASMTIYKEGEILTGWDGNKFIYQVKKLPGAAFKVTAGADIYRADGSKVFNKGDVVADNLVTGNDGQAVLTDLHLGSYVVTETRSVEGHVISPNPQTVKLEYKDQTVTVQYVATTVYNERQKAEVSVEKVDSKTSNPLSGGKYTLFAGSDIRNYAGQVICNKGTVLETVTTDSNGKAKYTVDLPTCNSYYISETKAPDGYIKNSSDVYSFEFDYMVQTTPKAVFKHTFKNDKVTAKIHMNKVDKDTGKAVPQGDASLKGAVYGLYARKDILHPDGKTGVLFKAGSLVATLTTDASGNAEVKNLYLGEYYLKEITPPVGYVLDTTEHDIMCDYEGDNVAEISRTVKCTETVMKQPFQLIKISDNGIDTEAGLLEKAGFSAYLKSALPLKENGSYDFKAAKPVILGNNGETELFTDEKGYLITCPLPYGTYVVKETVTPHNMDEIKPFEVKVKENNPTKPQVWRVFVDREFTAKLKVIKKDADTKQNVLIPNTEFKIFNLDTKKYVTMITTYPSKVEHTSFYTDEDGDLILPDVLKIGKYRIEEVSAPYGYVLNEDYVEVSIDSDTFYEVDPDTNEAIIVVGYEDTPVVGEILLEKKGEVLDSYKGGWFVSSEDKEFVYKECPLEGAEFEVYAAEDIYTADMQIDENGDRTRYYGKGELVTTVVTDEEGKATVSNLPLGTYKFVETNAPYGYVISEEEREVTLSYADERTPVVFESTALKNERQKIEMSVLKLDSENDSPIEGAVFGLFANENIINAAGQPIVENGTLLETAVSDKDGIVSFKKDYPFGLYKVIEIEAPKGYVASEEAIEFETEYEGQDIGIVEYSSECLNTPTTVEFSKTDITGENELEGAVLSVIDLNGKVIESWTSEKEPHIIKKLPVGKYVLHEETAPFGYVLSQDVKFEVLATEEVQEVTMVDEVAAGKIIITKKSDDGKKLAGAKFEIRDKDGKVLETLETNKKGKAESKELPIGIFDNGKWKSAITYTVVEVKAPDGYLLDSNPKEVTFKYKDGNTKVVEYTLDVTNKEKTPRVPKTGDDFNPLGYAALGMLSCVAGFMLLIWKKKDKKMKK